MFGRVSVFSMCQYVSICVSMCCLRCVVGLRQCWRRCVGYCVVVTVEEKKKRNL